MASTLLSRQLMRARQYQQAQHVAAYLAMPGEMNLDAAIGMMLDAGKTVSLPRVSGKDIILIDVNDLDSCNPGAFGLREPIDNPDLIRPLERIDLILMPLVAADRNGNRIGMGGGYYDRLLAAQDRTPTRIGIAHGWQIVDNIDPQPWDIPLHGLLTEHGWTWF